MEQDKVAIIFQVTSEEKDRFNQMLNELGLKNYSELFTMILSESPAPYMRLIKNNVMVRKGVKLYADED